MKKENNSHSMNLEIDSDESDTKFKKSKLKSKTNVFWADEQYQENYRELIEKEDFQGCLDLYNSGELNQKPRTIGYKVESKENVLPSLLKSMDSVKSNNKSLSFDWICIDGNNSDYKTSCSINKILNPKGDYEDDSNNDEYYSIVNKELGHNDYWYWIEDEEPSKNTFEFVQSIRKYKDKVSIFLITVDEKKFKYKYQFAGYGRFDLKQSICQGRLVFQKVK